MKKFLIGLLAALAMTAHADDALDHAITGQLSDVATTGVAIGAFDAVEANPLGVGLLVLKPAVVALANKIDDPTGRCYALRSVGNAGYAPAVANIATMAGVATGGAVVIMVAVFAYLQSGNAEACEGVADE